MGKGLPFLCSIATALLLLLPLASAIITPCTQYNSFHSVGNGNCVECTKLYFNKEELSKNDFIMVKDPVGNFYPMARPIIPLLKKPKGDANVESCYWCPELQLCGHPEDPRVLCPAPTDAVTRAQEQEQAAEQNSFLEVAATTRATSQKNPGGWVSKAECLDTIVNTRARYEDELRTVAKQMRQASVEARKEFIRAEGRRSRRSVDVAVRETRNVHNRDSWYDCFGPCVSSGKSACSQETRKIMPKGADPSAREPVSKAPSLPPSEEPVVCEIPVPTGGVTAYRAHGRYSPGSQFWGVCHLIPCEAMEYGD